MFTRSLFRAVPFFAVGLIFCLGACAEDKKPAQVRVLLLGDSTVIGSVCRKVEPNSDHLEDVVRKLLAAQKDLPPVEVVNKGEDGDMVGRLLAGRYEQDVAQQPLFQFIFIRYGLNDLHRQKDFATEFPKNYRKLIQRLRNDHPGAEIVLETVIPVFGEGDKTINDQVRAVAAVEKLPILDQYRAFAAEMKYSPAALYYRRLALKDIPEPYRALLPPEAFNKEKDFVIVMDNRLDVHLRNVPGWLNERHPNLAGYQVLGKQLAEYLAPRLRASTKNR